VNASSPKARFGKFYADYRYTFPRKILIAEAKREGIYFDFSVGQERRIQASLGPLLRPSPTLETAILLRLQVEVLA